MSQIVERAVLFADLRGSTSLYETMGNTDATAVVSHSVAELGRVVVQFGGHVVKTLGDGLLAVFVSPSAAVAAADEMHEMLEQLEPPVATRKPVAATLRLQVGLDFGEVVELGGDVFGDAVNVASRLLDHAGDNETLATLGVLDGLANWERERFRSLDRMQLRGRVEPVHVHLLESVRRFGDTATTAFGNLSISNPEPEAVRLVWLDVDHTFARANLPVILGRSPQATYIIDDTHVSRSHARIDWHGRTFGLTDLSYNGTYVRFDNDPTVLSLRRGQCTLHGSGLIGLGAPPGDSMAASVRFEVIGFDDASPAAPEAKSEARIEPKTEPERKQ